MLNNVVALGEYCHTRTIWDNSYPTLWILPKEMKKFIT